MRKLMKQFLSNEPRLLVFVVIAVVAGTAFEPVRVSAQALLPPKRLDQLVAPIALYPDPLLAQVLTASTYSDQLGEAARWADQHSYLTGDGLAGAIREDNLRWDASVVALLPFPSVLETMAVDMAWTGQLGEAVLAQRPDVMGAVQRMRRKARNFGYLQDSPQYHVVISGGQYIDIVPVSADYYYVPFYDPLVVFARPRVGSFAAITFGPQIFISPSFATWGWSGPRLDWSAGTIILDGRPWVRTRENRATYVHPYIAPWRPEGPRVERHELRPPHLESMHRMGGERRR